MNWLNEMLHMSSTKDKHKHSENVFINGKKSKSKMSKRTEKLGLAQLTRNSRFVCVRVCAKMTPTTRWLNNRTSIVVIAKYQRIWRNHSGAWGETTNFINYTISVLLCILFSLFYCKIQPNEQLVFFLVGRACCGRIKVISDQRRKQNVQANVSTRRAILVRFECDLIYSIFERIATIK